MNDVQRLNLYRHPILQAIYDVMQAIERCGASPELTEAVALASRLSEQAAAIIDERDALAIHVDTAYSARKDLLLRIERAEAERDALLADAERFAWWFSFAPKPDWFVAQYLQGVCEKFTLDQWRYAIDAARLAVEQDRAQREKREPHRALLALQKDGYVDVNSDDDHAQHLIVLRWTPERVWIESERNRELARKLRGYSDGNQLDIDAADALDGGER